MPPSAQCEGRVGEGDDCHILRLPDERLVDVFTVSEDAGRYTMGVSYLGAQMAQGQVGGVAVLTNSEGYAVCQLTVVSASPDPRFASAAVTHPGGGEIVGEEI